MSRGKSIGLFAIALLLWLGTVTHDFLGFIAPTNAQAIGFDLWTTAMWVLLGYSIIRLIRTFSKRTQ